MAQSTICAAALEAATDPESVEQVAERLFSAYSAGEIDISDLLGPLTAKISSYGSTDTKNPRISIPPTGHAPIDAAASCDVAPDDDHNRKLVSNVHPLDYVNAAPPSAKGASNTADELEYDLVVIGGGVAGLLSVIMGKAMGKRCAMVEKHYMGGDCLNVGCFPSKVLIASAQRAHDVRTAQKLHVSGGAEVTVDFPAIMERIRRLRADISPIDSVTRYKKDFCEEIFLGHASFTGADTIHVDGGSHGDRTIRFKKAMIATGASAMIPPIPGFSGVPHLTNNNFFNLTALPPRLVVIGGGPIGMELAQAMQRLGSEVSVLSRSSRILPKEDRDAADAVQKSMTEDGVAFHFNVRFSGIECTAQGTNTESSATSRPFLAYKVITEIDGSQQVFEADGVLNGTGRVPNVSNLGLDVAGVAFDTMRGVSVNEFYQTANPNVYACGDVTSVYKFTHSADFSARLAIRNMFFGHKFTEKNLVIPWCTFVDPEVAHVGLYEEELTARGIAHDTFVRPLEHVDRYICEGENDRGFVKIHVAKESDHIYGATIVSRNAGDMISEITTCMQHGVGLSQLAGTIHPYPTHQEAVRQCAAQYNARFKNPAVKQCVQWILDGREPQEGNVSAREQKRARTSK